eukprot:3578822-Pyramimonas_sp.AAC.1
MLRIRPTPHDLALSKVVQHLLHRTFLRNCTAAATPRSVQQVVQHCFGWHHRRWPEWCDHNLPAV